MEKTNVILSKFKSLTKVYDETFNEPISDLHERVLK